MGRSSRQFMFQSSSSKMHRVPRAQTAAPERWLPAVPESYPHPCNRLKRHPRQSIFFHPMFEACLSRIWSTHYWCICMAKLSPTPDCQTPYYRVEYQRRFLPSILLTVEHIEHIEQQQKAALLSMMRALAWCVRAVLSIVVFQGQKF